jgi:hypothetical protein
MIEFDVDGRLRFAPLWNDEVLWGGLRPGQVGLSGFFVQSGAEDQSAFGLGEIRLYSAPSRVQSLISPPSLVTRSVFPDRLDQLDTGRLRMKRIRYQVVSRKP